MANKTVKDAKTVHGTNPQYLIEKIIRGRIHESRYWKEECFALTADLVVDKGADLRYIGGIYGGNIKPTPFLCLTLKLLQIQPDKDIIIEFIRQENFKYIRALGAFYLRLTGNSLEVYKYLEPLYNDYRKLRRMDKMGQFNLIYMDEFIDLLLREERVFDVILPRLTKRFIHVENGELPPRVSLIDDDLEVEESEDDEERHKKNSDEHSTRRSRRSRSRSHSIDRDRHRSRHHNVHHSQDRKRDRDRDRNRDLDRDRDRDRDKDWGRDRSSRHHRRSPSPSSHRTSKKDRSHEARSSDRKRERRDRSDADECDSSKPTSLEDEIAQMNALRAKLGLKPLKP